MKAKSKKMKAKTYFKSYKLKTEKEKPKYLGFERHTKSQVIAILFNPKGKGWWGGGGGLALQLQKIPRSDHRPMVCAQPHTWDCIIMCER